MAGRTKKVVAEEQQPVKKATTTKKTTAKKSKEKVVDTVAVEVPMEEPKIEIEEVNRDREVFEKITERFYNLGDAEKENCSKIFESTKEQLKDVYSEENGALIAAAVADAALTVMTKIQRESLRQIKLEEAAKQRDQRKADRLARRKEREEARIQKTEIKNKSREERKARLGLAQ